MVKLTLLRLLKSVAFPFALIFLVVPVSYSQTDKIKYLDFLPLNYTTNFKKSVHSNINGAGKVDGEKISFNFRVKQDVGEVSTYKKKQWIKVITSADGLLGDAAFNLTLVHLYDLKSKLKMYEIIVEDETVKKYEWKTIPSLLTSGQAIDAGSYTESNKEGKVISTASISYLVTKIKNGYEFCEIDNIKNLETGEYEIIEECDLFTDSKKLTGSRTKANIGDGTEFLLLGKSVIK